MNFELGYGKSGMPVEIQDDNFLGIILPNSVNVPAGGRAEVKRSLEQPIGAERLSRIVKQGERVVIVTSDITRPVPSWDVCSPIIDELALSGVADANITIVFAVGSHRRHTTEEMMRLVGQDIYKRIRCIDSDNTDFVHVGVSRAGTSYDVFSVVANADRVICVGNIEFHYFAGYSGGAKAIMPGVCTRSAIQSNHSMMVEPNAVAGILDSNPVREDIDEVGEHQRIDYIVNVVLDEHKKILKSYAGHYIEAHRAGCAFLDYLYKVPITEKADIVVVSVGGYPKDINLYQAQKGLDNAKYAVKDGGVIIVCASCSEGFGESCFERWMKEMMPAKRIEEIKSNFQLGGHKAAAIAMVSQKADIFLVSDLPEELVKSIYLIPCNDTEDALDRAYKKCGKDAKVIIMPYGGSTLPCMRKEQRINLLEQ